MFLGMSYKTASANSAPVPSIPNMLDASYASSLPKPKGTQLGGKPKGTQLGGKPQAGPTSSLPTLTPSPNAYGQGTYPYPQPSLVANSRSLYPLHQKGAQQHMVLASLLITMHLKLPKGLTINILLNWRRHSSTHPPNLLSPSTYLLTTCMVYSQAGLPLYDPQQYHAYSQQMAVTPLSAHAAKKRRADDTDLNVYASSSCQRIS
ncbi:hypothetical protein BKA70DRAFT_1423330 [Coprinopsis sp. MPI-PUGE-AT-0042]|nr:hypothetical protein BKA70DRAFT_1423330 [Coprinopsis sp. MPI-PUGE-AT-0042]